jgi:hypothetical protein
MSSIHGEIVVRNQEKSGIDKALKNFSDGQSVFEL